jgi:NAD-reducing hydrogenase small subunit
VIPVDLYIPGCPPPAPRIRAVLQAVVDGKPPEMIGRDMLKFG